MYVTLIVIPMLMAIIALALLAASGSLATTALLLDVWGLFGTSAPVGWWTWLAKTLPDDSEVGGGLTVAIVQLAITLGATVGGITVRHARVPGDFRRQCDSAHRCRVSGDPRSGRHQQA